MRRIALLFSAFLFLGLLNACTVIREAPVPDAARADTESEEYRLSRDLLICFIKDDPSGFIRKLAPENAKLFTEEQFRKTRKETVATLGEPVSFRYLTKLEFVSLTPFVWAVRFRRTDRTGKEEFFSEALFRVLTGRTKEGEVMVLGFQVQ